MYSKAQTFPGDRGDGAGRQNGDHDACSADGSVAYFVQAAATDSRVNGGPVAVIAALGWPAR
jgi:hypothetical protein